MTIVYSDQRNTQPHLAWHETLELHELTAFQSNCLMAFKMNVPDIKDPTLRALYAETIDTVENNLKELIQYVPKAPTIAHRSSADDLTGFYGGQLLIFAKTSVRNYAIAITETATPQLRETLTRQLNKAIELHAKAFYFMYERGFYPSYNLQKLLTNDVILAKKALSM
ncbi:spore coat protein [Paenibacillus tarimensis]|uniref:spore coat protein n=1 Tax=Paenibacillus tarimensis TaxID=416012 RepID=UPI001F22B24F|nr:spore coat protein [Paenibacillus tarimensis]MCF2946445.1 spore coat protein [Paenibacillus tarimensis]